MRNQPNACQLNSNLSLPFPLSSDTWTVTKLHSSTGLLVILSIYSLAYLMVVASDPSSSHLSFPFPPFLLPFLPPILPSFQFLRAFSVQLSLLSLVGLILSQNQESSYKLYYSPSLWIILLSKGGKFRCFHLATSYLWRMLRHPLVHKFWKLKMSPMYSTV